MNSDVENSSQIFELNTKPWQSKQGDCEVIDYYKQMIALWQEFDLCPDEEWDCAKDSARHLRQMENERVYVFLIGMHKKS